MSSPSAPIETTPRQSPIPSATPSIISAPDNTPERPLTPQLARRTEPFDEEVASTFGRLSTIDYNQPEEEEDPYRAPPGFIPNSRDGRLFYPVYVKDSNYDATAGGSCTMLAPYIQYSSDYTKVIGTEGVGFKRRTIPVYIGKRARHFQKMTTEKWRYLRRDTDTEFTVNEALAEIGDPKLTGEVNRFRGLADIKDTMDKLLRDATQHINEIMREAVVIDVEFKHCTTRLELADAFQEINDRFHRSYPLPVRPCQSPERTPFPPRARGPVEMPVLADSDHHNRNRGPRCYKCHSPNHLVSVCPKSRKNRRCTFCGDSDHRVSRCPTKRANRAVDNEVVPEAPLVFAQATQTEEMSLLERIGLLERTEWTPEVCVCCRKQNPATQNWSAQFTKSATVVVVLDHTDTRGATPVIPSPTKMRLVLLTTTTLTTTCTGRMTRNTTTRQSCGDFVPEGGIVLRQCTYISSILTLFITCTTRG
jgi:hypothetical protein